MLIQMATGHVLPEPVAQGDLEKTPFAHVLLYVHRKRLNGTLVLWDAAVVERGSGSQDRIRFDSGAAVAGRLARRASSLASGLLPLFARPKGPYAFYGIDLVGDHPSIKKGSVLPFSLLAASLRGSCRDDVVDTVLARFGQSPVRLRSEDLAKFEFLKEEHRFVELIRAAPKSIAELSSISPLPPRMAERILYLLAITHLLEPHSAARPSRRPVSAAPSADRTRKRTSIPAPPLPAEKNAPATATPPPAPATLSEGERTRWEAIVSRHHAIESETHFDMLGVGQDATADEVRNAYYAQVKHWHPDRLPEPMVALKPYVDRIFGLLTQAHQVLGNPDEREKYSRAVQAGGGTPAADRELARTIQAAMDYQRVDVLVKKERWAEARPLIEGILQTVDDDANYHAARGWIVFNLYPADPACRPTILDSLERSLELNPDLERAHHYLGCILKQSGEREAALHHFARASELNPRNIEAAREVRLMRMRRDKATSGPPSFIQRLFTPTRKR